MEEKQIIDTHKKTKKIRTRVILVLAVLIIFLICAYISFRGTYLETIEIGQNFEDVFIREFKI